MNLRRKAGEALSDEDVAMLETSGRSNLRCCGGQWLLAPVVRLVDGKLHQVVEIDADIDDGSAVNAEGIGKFFGVFDDLCGGMRHWIHADDGILPVPGRSPYLPEAETSR